MLDPDRFAPGSFRSVSIAAGIRIIIGKIKGTNKTETQTYRFSKDKFTPSEARDWMKKHNKEFISFEEAKQ